MAITSTSHIKLVNMKYILIALFAFVKLSVLAQAPLDMSYGTNGISLLTKFPSNHCVDASLQTDGKLLNFYFNTVGGLQHGFFIFRLNTNGSLDTTFAANTGMPNAIKGVNYIQVSGCGDGGVIRQCKDGKIILADWGSSITKYNADGTTDLSYGTNGWASLNLSSNTPPILYIRDFYEDASFNHYYIAFSINRDSLILAKTFPNGQMDNSFGTSGVKAISLAGSALGNYPYILTGMFKQNGHILLGGQNGNSQGFVLEMDLNGNLQTSFGNNGYYLDNLTNSKRYTNITEYQNGDLYLGANNYTLGSEEFYMQKMSASGVIDNTFGVQGKYIFPYPNSPNNVPYIHTPSYVYNGTPLYVSSFYYTGVGSNQALHQNYYSLLTTGIPNNQFGNSGTWNTPINFRIEKMLCQADGKILAVGSDSVNPRIIRYASNQTTASEVINKTNNTIYQTGHSIYFSAQKDSKLSAKLFSMNGNLIKTYNESDFNNSDRNHVVQLPQSLVKGIYLFQLYENETSETIKVFY